MFVLAPLVGMARRMVLPVDTAGGAVFVLILHHSVWGGTPHISSAPTQGHPSPGRSALSSLRIGERPG